MEHNRAVGKQVVVLRQSQAQRLFDDEAGQARAVASVLNSATTVFNEQGPSREARIPGAGAI
jgi:hypothetical protein